MKTRQNIESNESLTLAPYAAHSAESLGRHFAEPEHELRTVFQRDRDRILHTSAFRRLEYKTQVFVNSEGDYYRTRLTHTLEVAQIARTVARALGVNEDLTEAISLAHDLGHTPFGHAGQDVMQELMKNDGGFEHNRQSFRILTQLESPYPNFPGLNLSHELLEGLMKHASECELPDGTLFVKRGFPTIEAQVANLCDEIAYNNHDIDDGLKSGLLTADQLAQVEIWKTHCDVVQKKFPDESSKRQMRLTVKALINTLVLDVIKNTEAQIQERGIKTLADVKDRGKQLVDYSPAMKAHVIELKKFLFKTLYRHPRVFKMSEMGQQAIQMLFENYRQDFSKIPDNFLKPYDLKTEPKARILCDYIAGMTDRFALEEAKRFGVIPEWPSPKT